MYALVSLVLIIVLFFPILYVKRTYPEVAAKIEFKIVNFVVTMAIAILDVVRIASGENNVLLYILVFMWLFISGYTFFDILKHLKGKK